MNALYYIILILFVLVCFLLVSIILMQSSKTGGMGSAMTGNVLNSAFGGEAADKLLVRTTAILAALFMIFAITLNVISTPGSINVSTSTSDPILDRNKLEDIELYLYHQIHDLILDKVFLEQHLHI